MTRIEAKGEIIARVKIKEHESKIEKAIAKYDKYNILRQVSYTELQKELDAYLDAINFKASKKEATKNAVCATEPEDSSEPSDTGDATEGSDS